MIQTNNYQTLIPQVINEIYSDCKDLGEIYSYIQPSFNTSDFELLDGFSMRCCEERGGVFYNIFRVK